MKKKGNLLRGNNVSEDLDYLLCLEINIKIFFSEISALSNDLLAVVEDLIVDFHDLLS